MRDLLLPPKPIFTRALKKTEKLRKKGLDIHPVKIEGRKILRTFWGKAWCDHLESFSDYQNRLPRGRTYVRNGSELYKVKVAIKPLARKKWNRVKNRCAGKIGSLLELLQGRLSRNVMAVVTDRNKGLFPLPGEISLKCNCPDWAVMCKHVAAVLYGVGARLDEKPALLFLLCGVDHEELISTEVGLATYSGKMKGSRRRIAEDTLADVFSIEISEEAPPARARQSLRRKQSAPKSKRTSRDAVTRTAKRKAKTGKTKSQARKAPIVTEGSLNLQTSTLDAWNVAKGLTKRQAWRRVNCS